MLNKIPQNLILIKDLPVFRQKPSVKPMFELLSFGR